MYKICPNCGAPMEQERFLSVCTFCGTTLSGNAPQETEQEHTDQNDTIKHYNYIIANEERISRCQFVELLKDGQRYYVTGTPFYANDGFLKRIPSPHFRLQFQCDGQTEHILIGLSGKRPATRLAIQCEDSQEVMTLQILHSAENYIWFKLTENQFLSICTSKAIDLSTDLSFPPNAQFNEFPIYASRFYNIAFNRMKFLYSTQVKLITDE